MTAMEKMLAAALDAALAAGATDATARFVAREAERVRVRNDAQEAQHARSEGLFVSARVPGASGASAIAMPMRALSEADAGRIAREAVAAARATAMLYGRKTVAAAGPPGLSHVITPAGRDAFAVPMAHKVALLRGAVTAARVSGRVEVALAQLRAVREQVFLGVRARGGPARFHVRDQALVGFGVRVWVGAVGRFVVRSAPALGGGVWSGGFEHVDGMDVVRAARDTGREALAAVDAPRCTGRVCDVVLDAALVGPLVYETLGRALEVDEPSFVQGRSGATAPLASPSVSVACDPTSAGVVASAGVDDEGVRPVAVSLLSGGRAGARLTDREGAGALALPATGSARAGDHREAPRVHLGHLVVAPGAGGDLDALCAGIADGVFLAGARAIAVDPRRGAARVVAELAWEIKGGKRTRPLRGAALGGPLAGLLRACDAAGGVETANDFGTWRRKAPGRLPLPVGHRAVALRLRQVAVEGLE